MSKTWWIVIGVIALLAALIAVGVVISNNSNESKGFSATPIKQ